VTVTTASLHLEHDVHDPLELDLNELGEHPLFTEDGPKLIVEGRGVERAVTLAAAVVALPLGRPDAAPRRLGSVADPVGVVLMTGWILQL
jgi:hypothetical protein